jgi:hypothetical protein
MSSSVPQLALVRRFTRSLLSYAFGARQNNLTRSASGPSQRWSSNVWWSGERNLGNSSKWRSALVSLVSATISLPPSERATSLFALLLRCFECVAISLGHVVNVTVGHSQDDDRGNGKNVQTIDSKLNTWCASVLSCGHALTCTLFLLPFALPPHPSHPCLSVTARRPSKTMAATEERSKRR